MDHFPALHPAEAGTDRRQVAPFATTHGCLVVKAAALVTSGEQSLAVWEPLVLEAVQQRYTNERTAKKVMTEASRLLRYLRAWGVFSLGRGDRRSGRGLVLDRETKLQDQGRSSQSGAVDCT